MLIGAMNHPARDPVAEIDWIGGQGFDFVADMPRGRQHHLADAEGAAFEAPCRWRMIIRRSG